MTYWLQEYIMTFFWVSSPNLSFHAWNSRSSRERLAQLTTAREAAAMISNFILLHNKINNNENHSLNFSVIYNIVWVCAWVCVSERKSEALYLFESETFCRQWGVVRLTKEQTYFLLYPEKREALNHLHSRDHNFQFWTEDPTVPERAEMTKYVDISSFAYVLVQIY